jgi:hypothetical protein
MSQIQNSKRAQQQLGEHRNLQERQRIRDLGEVMSTPTGRRFLFTLIDKDCRVFSPSYTGNSETFLNEGMRKVGIEKMKEAQEHHKDLYILMITEAFSGQKRDALVEEAAKVTAQGDEE